MEGWSLGIGCRGTLEKVHPIWAALPLFSLLSSTMHDSRRPALYSYLEVLTQLCLLPKAPTLSLAMSSLLLLLCGPGLQYTLLGFENVHTHRFCRPLAGSNQGWKQPRVQPERKRHQQWVCRAEEEVMGTGD